MKFAISNIAWPQNHEKEILQLIYQKGFSAIEIAPTRIWNDFRSIGTEERKIYKKYMANNALEICSMHSLFYGAKGVALFGEEEEQDNFVRFFRSLIELAHDLEVPRMIFGSPLVRKRNGMEFHHAVQIACEVLFHVAEYAYRNGTKILIEPLSSEETDFIKNHSEGIALVDAIGSKGFGLHLDAKALTDEQDEIKDILHKCEGRVEHFHVNEDGLGSFKNVSIPHQTISTELKRCRYSGYVSIEMRELNNFREEIDVATDFVLNVYGEAS